ncbi:glucans biosynthesis glucosyltransferase MdoH [Halomonas sp. M20]|uniref:glucans biosynthesis glucosyltransferase MdoH n=1 Tax=Halomonas sp. M20 TaxID=2763264 RepID=UPI001D0A32EB|nr:glucans biosynthesis glucosyltransferase MdoH [Halomonas sp. M20]
MSCNDSPDPRRDCESDEKVVDMEQGISTPQARESTPVRRHRIPFLALRRFVFFALAILTAVLGSHMMLDILRANGLTLLELTIWILFVVMFIWLSISFWMGIAGFLVVAFKRDPVTLGPARPLDQTLDPSRRIALVMPIYNEDVERVMAGLEATCHSLIETGQATAFDVYLLSDSTDDAVAAKEKRAATLLRHRLAPDLTLYYRRRDDNTGRKVGNLAEFCCRWGHFYESMLIIDADSVMGGRTMVGMAATMQANPRLGLLQTVPLPVRADTLFGRFLQFASTLHSPMLAAGQSVWQGDSANYWGHNAILRISAFIESCGLPALPGEPPLGGEILSHDFVEAALLRRAGWEVRLHAGVEESFEELPSNIIDYAKRDRRWCQGNMQHLRLLFARKLHWINRLHFLFGALAFMASLIWIVMLLLSTADAVLLAVSKVQFFTQNYQLFPQWPESRVTLIASLLVITVIMLVLPKLLGLLVALMQRRKEYGGGIKLTVSALLEIVYSILLAPLMMAFHAWFVLSILLGRTVSWSSQSRGGRLIPWREAWRRTWSTTTLGIIWGAISYYYSPLFFWWLSPVLLGMVTSILLIRFTSSIQAGKWLKRHGLLCIPAEVHKPGVLKCLERIEEEDEAGVSPLEDAQLLPAQEYHQQMPIQSLRAHLGIGGGKTTQS